MTKRFEFVKEVDLIKALQDTACGFALAVNPISEEKAVEKGISIIDAVNVSLVRGKSEEAKRLLSRFREEEGDTRADSIEMKYSANEGDIMKSGFNLKRLTSILAFLGILDKEGLVKLTVGKDYPITIENEHFEFILAPRVEAEEKTE
jgi:hypothetical protein